MALARLVLRNMGQRMLSSSPSSSSLAARSCVERGLTTAENQGWRSQFLRRFTASAGDEKSGGREVAVSEADDGSRKKSKLSPRRQRKWGLWRNNNRNSAPAIYDFFPSGLGNALMQATDNINRVFENISPSGLIGRIKEKDELYKVKFDVPGLKKEDVKITVEDGLLTIRGEHKEEDEHESDDEFWSSKSFGYYNTSILMPDDAKADEIKAELKNGVLTVVVPKNKEAKRDVKEVQVN